MSLQNWKKLAFFAVALVFASMLIAGRAQAQTTISTGSITGVVTDPSGAAVPGAQVMITNKDTGQAITVQTTGTGNYSSGALNPGTYVVKISAAGFSSYQTEITVQVNTTSSGNAKLTVGQASTTVEVTGTQIQVNTTQATVQGVLTSAQIANLPINGRNFLDLAQLEPGVQIQDGSNFDPTKVGFSSISFGGRFGRTARIEVDGVDVSDETVGTTTEDIPALAISEFATEQSTLDPSTELTSSGAVNVSTKSGTNAFHGDANGLFRANQLAAALPAPPGFPTTFQRNYMDGDLGGPIVKNKLFFYASGERILQHENSGVPVAAPFNAYSGAAPLPFDENDSTDRLDWSGPHGMHMFYRFSYFKNLVDSAFGSVSYQIYKNEDITRQHVVGADFNSGNLTHSIRFSYLKFQNNIGDAVRGSDLPFASFPVSLQVANTLFTGPNLLAPQETPQSDHQLKYDGSWIHGNHLIRYGADFDHIQGGGYAKFFGIDPTVTAGLASGDQAAAAANALIAGGCGPSDTNPGGISDPQCYPVDTATVGNGQGFSTENPAFGFPAGGLGPDNRLGLYIGDNWKVVPTVTVSMGLRWDRDTGRTDSDLNNPAFATAVNSILPGFGNPVREPDDNFGPQLGVAWDIGGHGTTVIRAGAGIYYENAVYNNVLFDRPGRLASGQFLNFPPACSNGVADTVPFGPSGPFANQSVTVTTVEGANLCNESVGQAAARLADFENKYQASVNSPGANPAFIPSLLSSGSFIGTELFEPNYQTPRSYQMNVGIQHQIFPGTVVSADFVRNIGLRYLLGIDVNHAGDVRYFDLAAAQTAIAATNSFFGCGNSYSATAINCAMGSAAVSPVTGNAGASMADYASNGLDSPTDLGVQQCVNASTVPNAEGVSSFQCAFPGVKPAAGELPFLEPIGRSVYDGLQLKLVSQKANPFRGLHAVNFQIAYALSRFTDAGGASPTGPGAQDQDFILSAVDNRNPLGFSGPAALDRTSQLSFGGYFTLPGGLEFSTIAHFDSPLANSLVVPNSGLGAGEIFRTDFTGDGTVQDLMPGTHQGEFDRGISASGINNVINNYNAKVAGQPTPAGQVLVQNGLFTASQLAALQGVPQPLTDAPVGQADMSWLRTFDTTLSWNYRIKERLTIKPSVSVYNLFNFANFDPTVSPMSGLLTGSACSINGTVRHNGGAFDCPSDRVGLGTGVYDLGAPRTLEFGLGISF